MVASTQILLTGILLAIGLKLLRPYFDGGVCYSTARLDGKVAIVTGSNTGIGKETVKDFVERGAKVYMACRSLDKANNARKDVLEETKGSPEKVIVMKLDLSSLFSVRQFAKEFKQKESQLDILVNNAGVMAINERTLTEDGFEMQFGTNHLGHFLLTNLLLDLIVSTGPGSRIVSVSSLAHEFYSDIQWDDINLEHNYGPWRAYAQSKLANVMFSRELAKKLEGTGVTTYSLHPGSINTDLQRHNSVLSNPIVRYFFTWVGKSQKGGAQTTICCAVDENLADETGKYYSDVTETSPIPAAESDEGCTKLWEESVKMVKLSNDEMPEMFEKEYGVETIYLKAGLSSQN